MLTQSRILLGLVAGLLFATGYFLWGLIAYMVGLLTDVLDVYVAREWNGVSGWGRRSDGVYAIIFNSLSGLGFVVGAVFVWQTPRDALYLLGGTLLLVVCTFPFIPPGSRAATCRSGVVRCVIIASVVAKLPSGQRLLFLVGALPLLVLIAGYALGVMLKDEQVGRNKGWFGAPPEALERRDQEFLRRLFAALGIRKFALWSTTVDDGVPATNTTDVTSQRRRA